MSVKPFYRHVFLLFLTIAVSNVSLAINAKNQEHLTRPLSVSQLPQKMIKQLGIDTSRLAGKGHEFYDAKVSLLDQNGHIVNNTKTFDRNGDYQLKAVNPSPTMVKNIWFFSPDGVDEVVDSDHIWEKCTYQAPCQKITQAIIDALPRNERIELWLAPGVYELPTHDQPQTQSISLRHHMNVVGRSRDFKNVVYDDKRPVIKGSIIWHDYSGHFGANGGLENVVVKTGMNPLTYDNGTPIDVNIFSNGSLDIINVGLSKTVDKEGYNIIADDIFADGLSCDIEGNLTTNIVSHGIAVLTNTKLTAQGNETGNVYAMNNYLYIGDSDFKMVEHGCNGSSVILDAVPHIQEDQIDANIESSTIAVTTDNSDFCSMLQQQITGVDFLVDSPQERPVTLLRSQIFVSTQYSNATAIHINQIPVEMSYSKVTAQSDSLDASAFVGRGTIYLVGTNHLRLVTQASALFFGEDINIYDEGQDPPMCQVNNDQEIPCW